MHTGRSVTLRHRSSRPGADPTHEAAVLPGLVHMSPGRGWLPCRTRWGGIPANPGWQGAAAGRRYDSSLRAAGSCPGWSLAGRKAQDG